MNQKSIFKSATAWIAILQICICLFPLGLLSEEVRGALILSALKDLALRAKTSEGVVWKQN